MASSIPHGSRSTANQVLAGVDLTRRWILVTGCDEEIGFETMNALAANGAHVFGLASSLPSAKNACDQIGPRATPVACDLTDLDSVAAAAEMIRGLQVSLDAIVTNAEVAMPSTLRTRYGVELQFLGNHIGNFALVNHLLDLVRNGTGSEVGQRAEFVSRAVLKWLTELNIDTAHIDPGKPWAERHQRVI